MPGTKTLFAAGLRGALTLAAFVLAMAVTVVGYYMVVPVDFPGLGVLGLVALAFPLHLLVVTIGAAGLGAWTWGRRGRLAAARFGLAAAATAAMALWPTVALWQGARDIDVTLSLGNYLANALRPNLGGPDPARSVVYGRAPDGTALMLDIWPATGAAGDGPHPAFVRMHGGGWIHGGRGEFGDWDRWLSGLGYDVFDVEYRLDPPARWRDEVGDVKCALGWVAAHAAEYHVDPARIGAIGQSAGGQLAMLAAFSLGDPQLPPSCDVAAVPVKIVVNLYGPTDLIRGYAASGSLAYAQATLRQYLGGTPGDEPERYRIASPISHIDARTPPTITLLGENDRIIMAEQARILAAALDAAGVPQRTYLLPATDHGFDLNWGGFATQIARAKIRQFLLQYD